jgi:type II secretory ATPase GspE/PulE/Tfp pilus assembly ATPase PilB-like protein
MADAVPSAIELKKIRATYPKFNPDDHALKKGAGCDRCHEGFKGRIGIFELLQVDGEIKKLISANSNDSEIRDAAVRKGMRTLRMAGLELAFKGLTASQEVLGVTDLAQ